MSGNSANACNVALTLTDDLLLLPALRRLQPIGRLAHCTNREETFVIRCHCNIVEGHPLEFVCIQDLDRHEVARKAPVNYATYGPIDVL